MKAYPRPEESEGIRFNITQVTNTYSQKPEHRIRGVRKEIGMGWKDGSVGNTNNLS